MEIIVKESQTSELDKLNKRLNKADENAARRLVENHEAATIEEARIMVFRAAHAMGPRSHTLASDDRSYT